MSITPIKYELTIFNFSENIRLAFSIWSGVPLTMKIFSAAPACCLRSISQWAPVCWLICLIVSPPKMIIQYYNGTRTRMKTRSEKTDTNLFQWWRHTCQQERRWYFRWFLDPMIVNYCHGRSLCLPPIYRVRPSANMTKISRKTKKLSSEPEIRSLMVVQFWIMR